MSSWRLNPGFIRLLIAVLMIGAIFAGYSLMRRWSISQSLVVANVPYFGLASTFGVREVYGEQHPQVQAQARGSAGASLLMVGGYWHIRDQGNPLIFPDKVREKIPVGKPGSLAEIAAAAVDFGYKAEIKRLYFGAATLANYLNQNNGSPVIVEQIFSNDVPDYSENYFRVVIGVNRELDQVIVHDYAFGQNQTMPWQAFRALWKGPKNVLLITPPNNRSSPGTPGTSFEYAAEPPTTERHDLNHDWYLGEMALYARKHSQAAQYYSRVVNNRSFSGLPGGHQLYVLNALMFSYHALEAFKEIPSLEKQVINTVPRVSVSWTGRDPALEKAMAWTLMGEAFFRIDDWAKAKIYAERALREMPDNFNAKQLLEKLDEG